MARNFSYNIQSRRLEDEDGYPQNELTRAIFSSVPVSVIPTATSTGSASSITSSAPATLTAAGTTSQLTLEASGTDVNIDVKVIPKGLGNFQTNWGYLRMYSVIQQSVTNATPTTVNFDTVVVDTFTSGAKLFSGGAFTNTSGRAGRYLINYQFGVMVPTNQLVCQSWISTTNTTAQGRIACQNFTATGTNAFAVHGSAVVQIGNNESAWIVANVGASCLIGSTSLANQALAAITITQLN